MCTILRLSTEHPVVKAQQALLLRLNDTEVSDGIYATRPVTSRQFFRDLSALTQRVVRLVRKVNLESNVPTELSDLYRTITNRPGRNITMLGRDPSAAATAAITVTALEILQCRDIADAGAQMRWLVPPPRAKWAKVTAVQCGSFTNISQALSGAQLSALEPALAPSDQLRHRCGTPLPRRPAQPSQRYRHVPALLWTSITRRCIGDNSEQISAALAAALVVVGTDQTLTEACSLLGGAITATAAKRHLDTLRNDERWQEIRAILIGLADAIDDGVCPIDYESRRALPFSNFLSIDDWREVRGDFKISGDPVTALQLVRCWMYERVARSPARKSLAAGRRHESPRLSRIPEAMARGLVERLDAGARSYLTEYGLGHEPLYWRPRKDAFERGRS